MDNYFIRNRETRKLELHFDRETYQALSNDQKSEIKSAFLWGRRSNCWISRAKEPNLWRAEQVAKSIGLTDAGQQGEKLTFAEQQERKAERAERRAERYETFADNAHARGEALQKPINDMHGDIAFFTQPNVNSAGGRAFTRRREKMFAAYDKGMKEFIKSDYWMERADTARQTANDTRLQDKGFVSRRIAEQERDIRKLRRFIADAEAHLVFAQRGEPDPVSGECLNPAAISRSIEHWTDMLEDALDKYGYYASILESLGGVQFSKENIKPGYVVRVNGLPACVVSTGPKNIKARTAGFCLTYPYAEIQEIISDKRKEEIENV